jgi:hypothetical protein
MKIKSKLQRLIRPALAASIIASAAIVGLTDPAAARGQGERHGGQGYSQDAPHGKKYGNFRKHRRQQYRRHYRGHRHGNRYFRPHRHGRGYGYRPISFMQKTLLHKHGYRTVQSVRYRPASQFRGHGPAYKDGAYIAIAYRPDGAYRVHLNPFSGLVIRAAFIGR